MRHCNFSWFEGVMSCGGVESGGGNSIALFWPLKQQQYQPQNWPEVPLEQIHALTSNLGHFMPLFAQIFATMAPFLFRSCKKTLKSCLKSGPKKDQSVNSIANHHPDLLESENGNRIRIHFNRRDPADAIGGNNAEGLLLVAQVS